MNVKAKLFVCGEERELFATNLDYNRIFDVKGKPTSALMGGTISVTFESQMYDDSFIEWMIADRRENKKIRYPFNLYELRDGKVVFYEDDFDGLEIFEYSFKDATLINYQEKFCNQKGMYVTLTISPAMQDYRFFRNSSWNQKSTTRYIKHWQESYVPIKEAAPYKAKEDTTPRFTCYYTDLQGNKQAEPHTGEEVYLVLKTENAIGKTIDIDLSNHTKDFIYNDKVIENDIIKDFKVTSSEHKLKLRVVVQQEGERETIQN
ncbi:type VI secretion system tube protein TssD [Tenacibaculum caenipelagi]|uniref:Uncharacterized protein n=1 Tax=Tenacibaculum caenipelagi TaxID=1325435 RepID=A0A4V6PWA6_9FLAO|nr:type VI secretion system tube protein TssD [Tenacibaculum caenipelagi]TDQ30352.1 hypothetical protein DFQ07_0695 [Tenacibaculum caenipelagi]